MKNDPLTENFELGYPRPWEFTIIGPDRDRLTAAARSVVGDRAHTLRKANISRTGRYVSLRLELICDDETDRNTLFAALREHEDVRMVI